VRYDATTSDPALGSIDTKNVLFFLLLFSHRRIIVQTPTTVQKVKENPSKFFSKAVSPSSRGRPTPLGPDKTACLASRQALGEAFRGFLGGRGLNDGRAFKGLLGGRVYRRYRKPL
jgi:hypothetical protein